MGVFFVQNDFVQCEANTSLLYLFTKQRGLALCRLLNVFQYAMTPLHLFIYLFIYLKMKLIAKWLKWLLLNLKMV